MISTHCDLTEWEGLTETAYAARKEWAVERLLGFARRVYPGWASPLACVSWVHRAHSSASPAS